MRRISFTSTVVVFATVVSMATAFATPPTGEISWTDMYRVEATDNAAVPITGGTVLFMGTYSVAPGGETGWRRLPGHAIFAVTKGNLMLHGGEGCAARDYGAGQAAVIPAGLYDVHNAGNEPLEFYAVFFELSAGDPTPLVEGPAEAAPASCSGVSGLAAGAPSGVSVANTSSGTFPGTAAYGTKQSEHGEHGEHGQHGGDDGHATVEIQAGRDIFATLYDVSPGWSSGWFEHLPAVNIMHKGELSYYEGRDGKCVKTETYYPGQAFYHPTHHHMAVNEGKENTLLTTVYFNLPHDENPMPVLGNQTTAADFSKMPPEGCNRLR